MGSHCWGVTRWIDSREARAYRLAAPGAIPCSVLVAPPGGELPPYGWTSKNYVICVCFHCRGTSSYHTTNNCKAVEQRATLIHRQYNRDWGTSYSRPPIDPYLTSPLLQNPGGATVQCCRAWQLVVVWLMIVHTLFLQPVKPRWPCICMYMVRVGVRVSIRVRVWVRFRVCHSMFRTRSSMFDRLRK